MGVTGDVDFELVFPMRQTVRCLLDVKLARRLKSHRPYRSLSHFVDQAKFRSYHPEKNHIDGFLAHSVGPPKVLSKENGKE